MTNLLRERGAARLPLRPRPITASTVGARRVAVRHARDYASPPGCAHAGSARRASGRRRSARWRWAPSPSDALAISRLAINRMAMRQGTSSR